MFKGGKANAKIKNEIAAIIQRVNMTLRRDTASSGYLPMASPTSMYTYTHTYTYTQGRIQGDTGLLLQGYYTYTLSMIMNTPN